MYLKQSLHENEGLGASNEWEDDRTGYPQAQNSS